MSEPFLNKECANMISYAYNKGYKISLFTTLMGMGMEDLEIIKDVVFDYVTLHIPDTNGNSRFVLDDSYFEVLEKFTKFIKIDNYSCHGAVHKDVKRYVDTKALSSSLMNRAGNLKYNELQTYAPKGEIVCQVGTIKSPGCWAPEVLPDGTVVLCCMDYGMRHILGNLNENSVNEILNSNEAKLVMDGMKNDNINILCRSCSSAVKVNDLGANILQKQMNSKVQNAVVNKIINAKNICVFGLGKYFRDTYFPLKYNEVIKANLFSDNYINEAEYINGGEIVRPENLVNYEDLLVITYVKNPLLINKRLDELGINNYINITDIFDIVENRE